ncbi:hypothetical protein ACFWAY_49040 [Rhodococcus sp. NPDC059968]|uniref:hypothetical protein n=1 Tax=Rhodococcus sp. NPDC059968 TaxID=3347017 RepID=UPI00366FA677
MAERTVNGTWSVVITGEQWALLHRHLFRGDGDEHGAVLRCGIARSFGGTRLRLHRGKPQLSKADGWVVADNINTCTEEGLALIAEYHARLGVGELVFIDPHRSDPTNLMGVDQRAFDK